MQSGKTKKIEVEASSGNVFADLGLPNAEELATKAALVVQLKDLVKQCRLSRVRAAGLLGVKAEKLEALFRGSLELYSTGRLLRFINLLNYDVEILIHPRRNGRQHGDTRVGNAQGEAVGH